MSLGPAIFPALLATLLYSIPAGSIHLLVRGLSDPRLEAWQAPEEAALWKQRYRHWSRFALMINRGLFAFFLLQLVALIALRSQHCDANHTHFAAAAANLHRIADGGFTLGFVLLFGFALAAIAWSATYLFTARQRGWADPRRKDPFIVHLVVVPLALILMWVAFAIVPDMVCAGLNPVVGRP